MENTTMTGLDAFPAKTTMRFRKPLAFHPEAFMIATPKIEPHPSACVCTDCSSRREIQKAESEVLTAQFEIPMRRITFGFGFLGSDTHNPSLTLDPKAPVAVAPLEADAEYAQLAAAVGLELPSILQHELEAWFVANFIEVYPIKSVEKYMDNLMLKLKAEQPGK